MFWVEKPTLVSRICWLGLWPLEKLLRACSLAAPWLEMDEMWVNMAQTGTGCFGAVVGERALLEEPGLLLRSWVRLRRSQRCPLCPFPLTPARFLLPH